MPLTHLMTRRFAEVIEMATFVLVHGAFGSPAELAPVIIRMPPSNSFESVVLPLSRARAGATFARRRGVSRIVGATRCFDQRSPTSTVGSTPNIELGAWSIV